MIIGIACVVMHNHIQIIIIHFSMNLIMIILYLIIYFLMNLIMIIIMLYPKLSIMK